MFLHFDVYGQKMSVQRKNGEWLLFKESDTSLRARVYDVVLPNELKEEEVRTYLADIYHELARAEFPDVVQTS
jgi:hypothetical protein